MITREGGQIREAVERAYRTLPDEIDYYFHEAFGELVTIAEEYAARLEKAEKRRKERTP